MRSASAVRRPPGGTNAAATELTRAHRLTILTSSSGSQVLSPESASPGMFTFLASGDVHIRFGNAAMGAATRSDYMMRAGIPEHFYCLVSSGGGDVGNAVGIDSRFRIIAPVGGGGSLWWWRTSTDQEPAFNLRVNSRRRIRRKVRA